MTANLWAVWLISISLFPLTAAASQSSSDSDTYERTDIGGGYAATGQTKNVGYTSELYDISNGLPTSDANYILGSSEGYIWIGGYDGIIRYDSSVFTRLDTDSGLTNGRALFEDNKNRIWVGTNDNGVVVIDGNETTHFTYKDGMPSSSIRSFAEDDDGNIYIAATAGVCYVGTEMRIFNINDSRLNGKRVLKLDIGADGIIYGHTKNGDVFSLKNGSVSNYFESSEFGLEKVSTFMADPNHDGMVYLCADENGDSY